MRPARVTITIVDDPIGPDDVTVTIGSTPDLELVDGEPDLSKMTPAMALGIALVSEVLPRLLADAGGNISRLIRIDPQADGGRN